MAWKFTPEIPGIFFRLRHINTPKSPMGWIGQAEPIINTNFHTFFGIQRINGLSRYELLELPQPTIFNSRKLAFRQESKVQNDWLIEVEVSTKMPLFNPPTEDVATTTLKSSVPVSASSVVLLPENLNGRKGVAMRNTAKSAILYVEIGGAASITNYLAKVAPGGYYELPFKWAGAISGIWDKTESNAGVLIYEFN